MKSQEKEVPKWFQYALVSLMVQGHLCGLYVFVEVASFYIGLIEKGTIKSRTVTMYNFLAE